MGWLTKPCDHYNRRWEFMDYHTCYPSTKHGEYGTVLLRYQGTCTKCGHRMVTANAPPQPMQDFFFENFDLCMAHDPRVIASREKSRA